jgi:hypothetical protein
VTSVHMEVWLCIVNLHTTTAWNNYYYYADDFAANADGVDSYATVKTAGKYRYKIPSTMYGPLIGFTVVREYKRTEGVSTTDLLRRYNCFF